MSWRTSGGGRGADGADAGRSGWWARSTRCSRRWPGGGTTRTPRCGSWCACRRRRRRPSPTTSTATMRAPRSALVVTGPNGSGKSTALRTVGRIALLCHTGARVPAKLACVPVLRRISGVHDVRDDEMRVASAFGAEMRALGDVLRDTAAGAALQECRCPAVHRLLP